jgi:hypothetical protein
MVMSHRYVNVYQAGQLVQNGPWKYDARQDRNHQKKWVEHKNIIKKHRIENPTVNGFSKSRSSGRFIAFYSYINDHE